MPDMKFGSAAIRICLLFTFNCRTLVQGQNQIYSCLLSEIKKTQNNNKKHVKIDSKLLSILSASIRCTGFSVRNLYGDSSTL